MAEAAGLVKGEGKLIVSACLAGEACRYDGKANLVSGIKELVLSGHAVAVCPECLGGLDIPREPCEIRVVKGVKKVYNVQKDDCTAAFEKGAVRALAIAHKNNVTGAVLKAKSPSCGCGRVYDGHFNGTLVDGDGITTALFKENGIIVITEIEWINQNQEE
ncbi:MAG: DUF523 domain-containing protein [Eubacterium sp.]